MIASMTAFGRTDQKTDIGQVIWEIRTVNHRYLEISIRIPDDLRMLETAIREHVSEHIKRGKIECVLRYEPGDRIATNLSVNTELVNSIIKAAEKIWSTLPEPGTISPVEILRWPGVINKESPDADVIGEPLLELLDKTLKIVIETRQREGEKINVMIRERCGLAIEIVKDIKKKMPGIMTGVREKLLARAQELKVELENERLEQELLLLTQKYDIAEELDRLETHIKEVLRVLEKAEPVGRRLDFIMQEMNREANTLGSKAAHFECSNASVDLKVLIEQMREQIQNVE